MFEKIHWVDYKKRVPKGFFELFFRKICQLLARFVFINSFRIFLYRLMGMKVGSRVYIGFDCFIDPDLAELITIEDRVIVSFRVIIVAHDRIREFVAPVLIKKRAFIGAGAIITPGMTIGENAIVGAGAVVTKDVPDGTTVAGNPARPINA